MIKIRDQEYYVPGLPKDLRIIYPQVIWTLEGYKGTFIAHFNDEHDSYAELNFEGDKPGWQKSKPVERVYVKYDPNKNLPNHEANIHNQIEKDIKALTSDVCVTNEANQNLTNSQKEILLWNFRMGHIGFQYVQ